MGVASALVERYAPDGPPSPSRTRPLFAALGSCTGAITAA